MYLNNNIKGIIWKVCACFCFAIINCIVRYLSGGSPLECNNPLPITMIVFFQNIIALSIILPIIKGNKHISIFSKYSFLHIVRVISSVLGVITMYISFKYLPISEVIALGFLGPLITIFSSSIILKENMNITRIFAILFSIIGSILILRPDKIFLNYEYYNLIILLPILSTLFFVIAKLLTRYLAYKKESPEKLVSYLLIFMVPVSFIIAVFDWKSPNVANVPWLMLLGIFAMIAHYSFSKAYALSEVSFLMPFGFTKFLSSVLIGYYIFSEIPRSIDIWLGIIFIFISIVIAISKKNIYYKTKNNNKN